ncbi:hypothetical protein AAV35_005115 [Salimicrobium jeotgali]|uniref:DUF2905 domain-containing protein n=2 Tax=Salimicrobium TaxID=351195 RepID=K2GP94_9BACI|nr:MULTISPECIES: DUF2905 domain-containing protein [Salimicrobium]AKG04222.1 hypothetical protein AAV35_005115 [Salimicrobium jeotgali]EKE32189.1 hypothetical protein MJ3_04434 [Salimicrobium jeotgali]MBM7695800.1 hypothetical protein [Salimicrobium jeotgali]PBB06792.1 DUF2905 domain-containing protein [Salimicrobium humidisoli]
MNEFSKIFIIIGIVFLLFGIIGAFIGKLPGDLIFKKGNTTFYFPVMTSIVVSIILSLIFYIVSRLK